jgi:hypothetical protein
MKRLFANMIKWLAHDLPDSPARQRLRRAAGPEPARTSFALAGGTLVSENPILHDAHEDSYPPPEWLGGR